MEHDIGRITTHIDAAISVSFDGNFNDVFEDGWISLNDKKPDFIFQFSTSIQLVGLYLLFEEFP